MNSRLQLLNTGLRTQRDEAVKEVERRVLLTKGGMRFKCFPQMD